MKGFKLNVITVLLIIVCCATMTHIFLKSQPKAYAEVSKEIAELCLELHTYIDGPLAGAVDEDGWYGCMALLNSD